MKPKQNNNYLDNYRYYYEDFSREENPHSDEIIKAEIMNEPNSGYYSKPSETQIYQKLNTLNAQIKKSRKADIRRFNQILYDTEDRLNFQIQTLQEQVQRTEQKITHLLYQQKANESRRTILILFSFLVAGVAYITLIHPLSKNQQPVPTPSPTLSPTPSPTSTWGKMSEPEQLHHFFGKMALAVSPRKGQKVRGQQNKTYLVTDSYRVRLIHPSTRQKSPGYCQNKRPEQVDAENIKGCIVHHGVDVGTPIGTPLFVIALPGKKATVECEKQPPWGTYGKVTSDSLPHWTFISHHLKSCRPGIYQAGKSFGTTGTAGTGPHLHFGTKYQGFWMSPPLGFVEWTLTGERPQV